ncbi:cytochrome P450 [Aspergillus karnatakaensis]|uniref:cytochrome P450 n=1 Tax=Aspergillus karnatakaensis TaxID=1810916 RepID=UPI003CCCDFE7
MAFATVHESFTLALLAQWAVIGLVTYWVAWIFYARWLHPLARFPGPFWASVSRVWTVLHVLPGDAEKTQKKLHEKYGPIVRIAPNELVISDPRAMKTIYGIKSGFTKTDFYLAFRPPWARFPDHFSSYGGKEHADRRRIVSNVYTMTSILQSEKYIEKCIDVWLEKLGEIADRKGTFEMWTWTRMYAYDVIGELYFSKMFGFLKSGGDHRGYIEAAEDLIPVQTLAGNMPTYIRGLFMFTGILFPQVRSALKALGNLTAATDSMLKERTAALQDPEYSQKPQRADILGKLLDIMHKNGKEVDFELADVKMESFGGFFAGSETTALTLTGILYHTLRSPNAYQKLISEILTAHSQGLLSTPHISYNEATKLPYLFACIKEGIRMHPITGVSFPRHAPASGCEVAGHWIPGGTRIGANPCTMHFDKSVFGDDADVFRPERWLQGVEVGGRDAKEMERYIMQFGMGSRTCLGKNISMCEITKAIPQLLLSYDFELTSDEEMQTTSWWLHKPVSVDVKVRRR